MGARRVARRELSTVGNLRVVRAGRGDVAHAHLAGPHSAALGVDTVADLLAGRLRLGVHAAWWWMRACEGIRHEL
jgi:hypothetical protein